MDRVENPSADIQHVPDDKEVPSHSGISDWTWKEVKMAPGEQLAVIPSCASEAFVQMLSGEAEIFGSSMVENELLTVTYPQRAVIASHSGCHLRISAADYEKEVCTITDDPYPTMVGCIQVILQEKRKIALETGGKTPGPNVLVVGPMDSGKSSCCRTLVNYAVAAGWKPVYVDLDAGQQNLTLPGSISAARMTSEIGANGAPKCLRQVDLPFGRIALDEDPRLYKQQIQLLAEVTLKAVSDPCKVNCSGEIINTAGWIDDNGFAVLLHIIQCFQVNVIVAMEDAALGNRLKSALKGVTNSDVEILYCRKPTHLLKRSIQTRRDYRDHLVHETLIRDRSMSTVSLSKLVFYQLASFHAISLRNGKRIAVCNQVIPAGQSRDRILAVSTAPSLAVDVKSYRIQGYAVLYFFDAAADEARVISTVDLNGLPAPIILLRTEVFAPGY